MTSVNDAPMLLLKDEPNTTGAPGSEGDSELDGRGPRIRCPKCRWEPSRDDQWQCSCLHLWNTFETRGVCPACGRKWADTQCPRCILWSPHEDWYEAE